MDEPIKDPVPWVDFSPGEASSQDQCPRRLAPLEAISVNRPISRHFRSWQYWIGNLSRADGSRLHVRPRFLVDLNRPCKTSRERLS